MRATAARAARTQRRTVAPRRRQHHAQALRAVVEALEQRALLSSSIGLSNTTWTFIGPAPVGDVAAGYPSGRVTGIAPHPTDLNRILIATAGGGVWRSTSPGTGWSALSDDQGTLVMGAIEIAPSNPNVIYAGTGEANNSADSYYGRGVLKSTDGGTTWTLLGSAHFDRRSIAKIVVDPTNANIVYVAVSGGTNGVSGNRGIWKSSDGGTSWSNTTTSITPSLNYSDLVIDPGNPQVLYAAVGASTGSVLNGIYKSIDGGVSWLPAGDFPNGDASNGRIRIAISPSSPSTLYASIAHATTGALYKLVKSIDGGTHWFDLPNTPNFMGTQGWYGTALAVDPTNANIVYAAGASWSNSLIRSADGGNTWADIHAGALGSPHGDHHALAFDINGRLLDGNDGGIWRLDNATPGSIVWTSLNKLTSGAALGAGQLNGIAVHPTTTNIAYGAAQAVGTVKFNDSLSWSNVRTGTAGFVRIDSSNPNTVYHTYERQGAGGTAGTNFLERSDDGGNTWNPKTSSIASTDPANLYIPYMIAPDNSSRLLLGTNRVYESFNRGDSWTPISTPGAGGWTTTANIDAIASAKTDPNTIYATAGGHVYVTTNHGAAWTQRDIPGFADHLRDLVVDPTSSLIVYAVRDRFSGNVGGNGHVFRSLDGGVTWSDLTSSDATASGYPDLPAMSIDIHPRGAGISDDVIYIGTDAGVYMEDLNTPQRWVKLGGGLPNVQVADVEVNVTTRTLTAGTHGRGAWQLMLDLPGSISGRVMTDFDADGVLDANEAVVPNLTIYLDANNNNGLDAGETFTTTNATGDYTLGNLTQGTYRVRAVTLANYVVASPSGGALVIDISNGVNFTGKDFTEFPITYSGSGGNDNYLVRLNPSNTSMVQIIQTIGTLVETFTVAKNALTAANATLTFSLGNGDDLVTIDHAGGVPYGSGGATYIGGAQSTSTGDRLVISGSSGTDTFTVIQTAITNSGAVSYSQLESILIDTLAGSDTVSVSGALSTAFHFTAGTGSFNTLNLSGGASYTFTQDARIESSNLGISLSGSSAVSFNSTQHLRSLILGTSSRATLSPSGSAYLQTAFLSVSGSSRLDLNDNDFVLDYSDGLSGSGVYTTIEAWVLSGYGNANGSGIGSATSLSAPGAPILALFDNTFVETTEWPPGSGNLIPQNSVLGKYTYFGDMNLDGQVTGDDYTVIDANLGMNPAPQRIRWLLGDANLDGQISGDDYTVIDANLGHGVGAPL